MPEIAIANELLGDGGAALHDPAGIQVGERGPRDPLVFERTVVPEAAVLDRHGRPRQPARHPPQRHRLAVATGGHRRQPGVVGRADERVATERMRIGRSQVAADDGSRRASDHDECRGARERHEASSSTATTQRAPRPRRRRRRRLNLPRMHARSTASSGVARYDLPCRASRPDGKPRGGCPGRSGTSYLRLAERRRRCPSGTTFRSAASDVSECLEGRSQSLRPEALSMEPARSTMHPGSGYGASPDVRNGRRSRRARSAPTPPGPALASDAARPGGASFVTVGASDHGSALVAGVGHRVGRRVRRRRVRWPRA
jgi:hypothetical protein